MFKKSLFRLTSNIPCSPNSSNPKEIVEPG